MAALQLVMAKSDASNAVSALDLGGEMHWLDLQVAKR